MSYSLNDIARIIGASPPTMGEETIEHLVLDSRKLHSPANSLFFAIKGKWRDGQSFIPELYKKGFRNFVVSDPFISLEAYPGSNFLVVDDSLLALQQLAAYHRSQFQIPVIGITGSNGKTIVKEWLYQLLHGYYDIVRSPRSYNSQIGVPLSVWQMNETNTLAIFESGISKQGEMIRLERIIQPTIGVLTNIGEAHSEGFNDNDHKFREKLTLFKNSGTVIGRAEDFAGREEFLGLLREDLQVLSWGNDPANDFILSAVEKRSTESVITLSQEEESCVITIPFTDDASVENAITCACVLWEMGISVDEISLGMRGLQQVNMRLELKKGINHCSIINDSYSADLSSLEIALGFLDQQGSHSKKTVILSEFLQSALPDEELYERIVESLQKHSVGRLIGIGERISASLHKDMLNSDRGFQVELYSSTKDFLNQFRSSSFKDEVILVKGARAFAFERIVLLLEQKVHQTVLEVNLNAIASNIKQYQQLLSPGTRVMAMVKAFAYGSGGAEIAGTLQYHGTDYLGVAYADEGVELRKSGITLPIMVMNPEESAFETIIDNELEPEIYSFQLLESFRRFLVQEGIQHYPVHIEIETGMNRLGFATNEMEALATAILKSSECKVVSAFTHLAASEEPGQDKFTLKQYDDFQNAAEELKKGLGYSFLCHIANSAATLRLPQLQMDMVRIGIGLYGVDSANTHRLRLEPVATLKSTVSQIKKLKPGETVSYNRKGIVNRDSIIATIRIGYADGYPRRLGNGVGKIWINSSQVPEGGKLVPLIGAVCMDMIMVDVTDLPGVQEGDDVIIFGKNLPIQELAEWAETIPYEIMTGISQRVKRVYYEE